MQNNNFQNFSNFGNIQNPQNFQNMQFMPNMQSFQNISSAPSFNNSQMLINEFNNLSQNPMFNFGFSIGLIHSNDYTKWRITIIGANDTPYAGGIYKVMINFPNNYPNTPPIIYFITPIYHLNINPYANQMDPLGYVPIDKLNIWKPEYTMKEVFTYLYGLFYYADPTFGYGNDRVNEYRNNKNLYFEKVKLFVNKYASQSNFSLDWGNFDWNFNIY